ncbi:hypothetical protein CONLIGDRAFT_248307 [Coniochaeta ligniaria NRRL 30616]|uniref:Secreted protein n=1 Tax=Coniochaeta ligniaria NRRL 30616 TaxID=1408157 RepID=A0A1J7JRI6_9PEZI|nr:hypothetical protein CONLIGDRAFT_248307 [Coniochaeta ligniaria NRRL 30616]
MFSSAAMAQSAVCLVTEATMTLGWLSLCTCAIGGTACKHAKHKSGPGLSASADSEITNPPAVIFLCAVLLESFGTYQLPSLTGKGRLICLVAKLQEPQRQPIPALPRTSNTSHKSYVPSPKLPVLCDRGSARARTLMTSSQKHSQIV